MSQKSQLALVNRRYLRIKVFQGLYSFYRTESPEQNDLEKGVFESIAKNDPLFKNIVVPSYNSNELELDDDKGTRVNSLDLVGKHYLFRDINDKNV